MTVFLKSLSVKKESEEFSRRVLIVVVFGVGLMQLLMQGDFSVSGAFVLEVAGLGCLITNVMDMHLFIAVFL